MEVGDLVTAVFLSESSVQRRSGASEAGSQTSSGLD